MFYECKAEYIDLGGIDTSETTNMSYMFTRCTELRSIDLSMLDGSKVITTESMVTGCNKLK